MRLLALFVLLATPIFSSVAVAEKKANCDFTCYHPVDPAICNGETPCLWPQDHRVKIFPKEVNAPLQITPTFESTVSQQLKPQCEKTGSGQVFKEKRPFCHLESTYREVYTFKDAETGIELLVGGEDNATVSEACTHRANACFYPEALDACQQLGYELHKTLELPTLRLLETTGLMKRFKESDAAKALAQPSFWVVDAPPADELGHYYGLDTQYYFDLTTMKKEMGQNGPARKSMFALGLVCAVHTD